MAALVLLVSSVARAQQNNGVPGLSSGGYKAIIALLKSNCANYNGNTCSTTVCNQQVNFNANNTVTVPSLSDTFNYQGTSSAQSEAQAIQFLNVLGTACGGGAGDGILATGSSLSVQNAQVENIGKLFTSRSASAAPSYGAGGVAEASGGTYGGSIPIIYGLPLSKNTAFSTVGYVSYANQAGTTNQAAVSGSPAYAWQVKDENGNRVIGVAAYVPLSFAFASIQNVPNALITWGGGAGAIATGSLGYRAMRLTYGAGGAFRVVTGGNFAVPLSLLARADEPLEFISSFLSGFVSVSYGNDFLNAGNETWVLGTGASFGKYEFGYRGYYGNGVVSHTLGFSIRKELIGEDVLDREIPSEEEKRPTGPTIGPIGPQILLPAGPRFTPLPPPPEIPKIAPECTTDLDCPGDDVCEEQRCLPPL